MIRLARPEDVPRIGELIRELAEYERYLDQARAIDADLATALFAASPAVFAHVAEADGEVVGYAMWYLTFSTWTGHHGIYLEDLYVAPGWRGQGLGRALLARLAGICAERGYDRLEWAVLDWNAPAIGFYRSIGAAPMTDWIVNRLSGDRLAELAVLADQGGEAPDRPGASSG